MEKDFLFNQKNPETCTCQCHFSNPICYHLDCCFCCSQILLYPHESSSNIISHSFKALESPRILIPHKEKNFYIKSEQRNKMPKFSEQFKNKVPFLRNKINNIILNKSNTEVAITDIYKNNDKKKPKIIKEKKEKPLYRKIKVNKNNNQERIYTIPNYISKRHKNNIDINNFYPNSIKRNKKIKKLNDYELNINRKILVNKNFNLTNITPKSNNSNRTFNSQIGRKFVMGDKNDDIINIKQNQYSSETNDTRVMLQNIKKEIDKTKNMINNLKSENKKLKNKLNKKEQKNTDENKIGKIEDNLKIIKENKDEKWEKDVIDLKNEIKEITNKLGEYENFIALLKKRNSEQETIIENKNKEILDLIIKLGNLEKSINYNESKKEKLNISIDEYKNMNNNLQKEILKLKLIGEKKDEKIKELEIKLKFEKNYNNKKQKISELLFNFYQNLNRVMDNDKPKESFQNIINIITVDDFKIKLNKVEKKIIQVIEDMQIKYGHCFACDIACCTSQVDKLKTFRKNASKKK